MSFLTIIFAALFYAATAILIAGLANKIMQFAKHLRRSKFLRLLRRQPKPVL
jgi:hypothetical protein